MYPRSFVTTSAQRRLNAHTLCMCDARTVYMSQSVVEVDLTGLAVHARHVDEILEVATSIGGKPAAPSRLQRAARVFANARAAIDDGSELARAVSVVMRASLVDLERVLPPRG